MSEPLKLLFICTHNRCRSILCEAIANQTSQGKLLAKSAGSTPAGEVHPLTLKHLQAHGFSTEGLQSQSWDEHENFQADVVFTVCDNAAGESCPLWFGSSVKAHWGLQDPSKLADDEAQADAAFSQVITLIQQRVAQLTALAEKHAQKPLSKEEISTALSEMGAVV